MTDVSLASSPATGGGERLLPTASTLTAPTTPGSSTNNNINNNNLNNTRRGGGGGGGGHFSHQFNHHNLFVRQDRGIDGALPQHMKQLILEASPARLRGYDAEKVLVRTDQVFAVRDAKIIAADKERRSLDVAKCGFCSDPKEPYKTMGELYLDSDALIYRYLKIDPDSAQNATRNQFTEERSVKDRIDIAIEEQRRMVQGSTQKQDNGFSTIKSKVEISKARLHAVKFGVPFVESVSKGEEKDKKMEKKVTPVISESGIDWRNLKIDTDKQIYYNNLYERRRDKADGSAKLGSASASAKLHQRLRSNKLVTSASTAASVDSNNNIKKKRIPGGAGFQKTGNGNNTKLQKHIPAAVTSDHVPRPTTTLRNRAESSVGGFDADASLLSRTSKVLKPPQLVEDDRFTDVKAMEQELNVSRKKRSDYTTTYLQNRDEFYEQRFRLTQLLVEDLNRMDFERKMNYQRKFKSFDVSKNLGVVDDMENMRQKATTQRNIEKEPLVKNHPWFNDMLVKVVMTGGIKRTVSHYEQLLIDRIIGIIEDQLPFNQSTFVKLLKVIPTHEIMKDEIQRIIRYVKQHETITEKEYVEAIELAGHSI